MPISSDLLGEIYGVSSQRLRLLRSKGAPVESPDALFDWLKEHGSHLGPLLALLLDAVTRSDLQRRINFICHESHP
ncbi:MAG: hypothetical protein CMP31_11725 [Roseibacillus sp.]|nr:hypothetical protein [Roseibacillus sp.]